MFVSIRAPRAGRDPRSTFEQMYTPQFLSARPGRGATRWQRTTAAKPRSFYPRAPGGARQGRHPGRHGWSESFYPRAPGGARPVLSGGLRLLIGVSIRAPRAGRDPTTEAPPSRWGRFYPRAPGGARRADACRQGRDCRRFYPRAPGGARRRRGLRLRLRGRVSIRAPRAGRDTQSWGGELVFDGFYPRAPGGARQGRRYSEGIHTKFLSARPGRGATRQAPHYG